MKPVKKNPQIFNCPHNHRYGEYIPQILKFQGKYTESWAKSRIENKKALAFSSLREARA
jgi:hypothetical protein